MPGHSTPVTPTFATLLGMWTVAAMSNFLLDRPSLAGTQLPDKSVGAELALFGLNSLVLWCVVAVIYAIIGRLWLTAAVVVSLSTVIAFANQTKLIFRFEPIYPTDFRFIAEPAFLLSMVDARTVGTAAFVVALVIAICLIWRRISQRKPGPTHGERPTRGFRLLLLAVGAVLLGGSTQLPVPHSPASAVYRAAGADWLGWHQNANYQANGFVAGFLYNFGANPMTPPQSYSAATMDAVVKRYKDPPPKPDALQENNDSAPPNIVLVLSESFIDPDHAATPRFAVDPIPFTHRLMNRTTSGVTLAASYGGGTANMEFAALTGFSLRLFSPQTSVPYQQLVPSRSHFPSVVGYLKSAGYHATALHPHEPGVYRRDEVYRSLSFDEFLSRDAFPPSPSGQFVPDSKVFDRTLAEIDRQDVPLFANVVTMQNHGPYDNRGPDPIPAIGDLTPLERSRAENHARGLRDSDSALKEFLGALEARDEETVVLYYGDHYPGYLTEETYRATPRRLLYEPPFILWTSVDTEHGARQVLPTLSPIYFMNLVFEAAELQPPPYYRLLSELQQALPGINPGMLIGPDNKEIDRSELSPRTKRLLRDYRLVQYDLAIGEQHSLSSLLYSTTTSQGVSPAR